MLHSTEQSMASTFTKTTENGGISIAQASSTSWGVSTSVSNFVAEASISAGSSEMQASVRVDFHTGKKKAKKESSYISCKGSISEKENPHKEQTGSTAATIPSLAALMHCYVQPSIKQHSSKHQTPRHTFDDHYTYYLSRILAETTIHFSKSCF